ncbi:MAG: hypothetical protein SGARI_006560 [Bacillariaceae sp.]
MSEQQQQQAENEEGLDTALKQQEQEQERQIRLHRRHSSLALVSSFLFLAGMVLASISVLIYISASQVSDRIERVFQITAMTAMGILAASVLPEIVLDCVFFARLILVITSD